MAEVQPLSLHRLRDAFQGAQQDLFHHIGGHVQNIRNQAAKVVEPLSKHIGNLNNNVMTPLNVQVHGALAKISAPAAVRSRSPADNSTESRARASVIKTKS